MISKFFYGTSVVVIVVIGIWLIYKGVTAPIHKEKKYEKVGDYNQYLRSSHWRRTRARKLRQQPYCSKCGRMKNLQVHHLRYWDKSGYSILYKERMDDLQVLCKSCHHNLHRHKKKTA